MVLGVTSKKDATCSLSTTVFPSNGMPRSGWCFRFVSFAATSGAYCGIVPLTLRCATYPVSFAATSSAHCGMAAVDPNLAELLSHSPRRKTISLRMDSTFQRPKTISLRRKTVSPRARRDCPKAKTISPEVKMVSQAQDQDSQSANSIPVR